MFRGKLYCINAISYKDLKHFQLSIFLKNIVGQEGTYFFSKDIGISVKIYKLSALIAKEK